MKIPFFSTNEPEVNTIQQEKVWRQLKADIQEHQPKLKSEFLHRFRGDIGFATFSQIQAQEAQVLNNFPNRDTKERILSNDPLISGDFTAEPNLHAIFLKGKLALHAPRGAEVDLRMVGNRLEQIAPRKEQPFCIQIIPGTSPLQKKRYLALVHLGEKYDNYLTSRYFSSLGELVNDNGTALTELIQTAVQKVQGKAKK